MKSATKQPNIVESNGFSDLKYQYKLSTSGMSDEMRNQVSVAMTSMLGTKQAVAVRVAAD